MEIKSQKSKTDLPASDAAARAPGLMDILNIDPLQQGQALQAASKKRKKQQKRAGAYDLVCPILYYCIEVIITTCNHTYTQVSVKSDVISSYLTELF